MYCKNCPADHRLYLSSGCFCCICADRPMKKFIKSTNTLNAQNHADAIRISSIAAIPTFFRSVLLKKQINKGTKPNNKKPENLRRKKCNASTLPSPTIFNARRLNHADSDKNQYTKYNIPPVQHSTQENSGLIEKFVLYIANKFVRKSKMNCQPIAPNCFRQSATDYLSLFKQIFGFHPYLCATF